jgi:acyl-CoA-binding protein
MTRLLASLCATSLLISQAQAIEFHRDLPEDQRRSMEYDLAVLDRVVPKDDDASAEAAKKMGIDGKLSATSLRAWLETRTHYIVPQDWDIQAAAKVESMETYPNSDLMPDVETPTKQASDGKGEPAKGTVTVVMANIGTAIYYWGKQSMSELSLDLGLRKRVKVLSPRLGLIKVGQGLFSERFRIEKETADTNANALLRLATLFHESRHSDGNGKSLGFFHAVCAEGKYAGYNACDRNRNGPYTVGANTLKGLLAQCDQCSVAAKESLRTQMLDSYSRVIQETSVPKSDLETTLLKAQVMLCDMNKQFGKPEADNCPALRAQLAASVEPTKVPTTDLDANPETLAK